MDENYKFTLGQLIYTIRKINLLTQVEFSKQIGVVQSTISKIEKDIFEDVPFSVVARVANDFKVPLAHFSTGNLPIRITSGVKKVIPRNYLDKGVFRAKTIFLTLETLKLTYGDSIYKDLKLPQPYMCLSNLHYSFEFVNNLYGLSKDSLLTALNSIDITGSEELEESNLEKYFSSIYGIQLMEKPISIETGFNVMLQFNSSLHELDNVYLKILELEIQSIFKTKIVADRVINNNIYQIELQYINV